MIKIVRYGLKTGFKAEYGVRIKSCQYDLSPFI